MQLRAFNAELGPTLSLTTALAAGGRYRFELSEPAAADLYRVGLTYNGLEFGSEFGRLSAAEPELELPVTVYEQTADPAGVRIQDLIVALQFEGGALRVNELYTAANQGRAVFMGQTGDPAAGVFRLALPAAAQAPDFQRGLGAAGNFIPAAEVIPAGDGYADTLPLRPGPAGLVLLARYTLTYSGTASLSHRLIYPAAAVTLLAPDGVLVGEGDGWLPAGAQNVAGQPFNSFRQAELPAGAQLTLSLLGWPAPAAAPLPARDAQAELLVGAGALALVGLLAAGMLHRWRAAPAGGLGDPG